MWINGDYRGRREIATQRLHIPKGVFVNGPRHFPTGVPSGIAELSDLIKRQKYYEARSDSKVKRKKKKKKKKIKKPRGAREKQMPRAEGENEEGATRLKT